MTDKRSPDLDKDERARPVDEEILHWFEIFNIWLEIESDGELYTHQELHWRCLNLRVKYKVYYVRSVLIVKGD